MKDKNCHSRAEEFLKDIKYLEELAQRQDEEDIFKIFKLGKSSISNKRPEIFCTNSIVRDVNKVEILDFDKAFSIFFNSYRTGLISNSYNHEYKETDRFNFIIKSAFSDCVCQDYERQQFVEEAIPTLVYRRGGSVAQVMPLPEGDAERHAKILTYANSDKKSGKKMMIDFIDFIQALFLRFNSVFGKVADEESEVQMVYGGNSNRFNELKDGRSKLARFYQSIGGQLRRFSEKEEIYFFKNHRLAFDLFGAAAFKNFTKSNLNIYEYGNTNNRPQIHSCSTPRRHEKVSEDK